MKKLIFVIAAFVTLFFDAASAIAANEYYSDSQEIRLPIPRPPNQRPSLCPRATDLIVLTLPAPQWDAVNHQSVIRATVQNIGGIPAQSFDVRLQEGTTTQYRVVQAGLGSFSTATVEFRLPYWVYRPDAYYIIQVNSARHEKNECNYNNNSRTFQSVG